MSPWIQKTNPDRSNILILSYHSVSHRLFDNTVHVDPVFSVTTEQLRMQFQIIRKLNVPVISLDDYESIPAAPLKIIITFDDGHPSDYRFVFPLLEEFGFTAAFFICLRNIDAVSRWQEYRELSAVRHIIGSHGITHQYLTHLKPADAKFEIEESRSVIRQKLNTSCNYFAFPGGRYNSALLQLAKRAGFKKVMTTDFGLNDVIHTDFALKRWQIRRNTSLKEFQDVLKMNSLQIFIKESRKYLMSAGKAFLGDSYFDSVRKIILRS